MVATPVKNQTISVTYGTDGAKIASGRTQPGATNWQVYHVNAIYVDVDTSAAGFTQTPVYVTSIGGDSQHYGTDGASAVYSATATGFRIFIKWDTGYKNSNAITPEEANASKWHINWIAIEPASTTTLLGVGTDNELYTRDTLTSNWVKVPNSGAVTDAIVMPDGKILGIGMNNELYTRDTLTSNWVNVPNSGSVIGVTIMPDGTIVGIGMDKELYTRATLTSNWVKVPNSGSVFDVTTMPDGTILGVGLDNQLYTRATLTSNWVKVPNSGAVTDVTIMPDGKIVGIGMNKELYTRATLTSNWVNVPNSGPVISVAAGKGLI